MAEKKPFDILPDADALLSLEPEEVAGIVIEWINSASLELLSQGLVGCEAAVDGYPEKHKEQLQRALMEGWTWLKREGLVAPAPDTAGAYFVTRRGKRLTQSSDLASYRNADLLPRKVLHPVIMQRVYGTFLRGDYDTAVFQAFKEVEVAVRAAGGFSANDLGATLMRKAFHETNGPLTDATAVESERQAMAHLFAGAVGAYKNPGSHRHVTIDAPTAVELIGLASHLLKTVDGRVLAGTCTPVIP